MPDLQQVRKGSTPILILSVLADGKKHGYAIMRELEARSQGYFSMTAALLYPTLHQMEQDGLVQSTWEEGNGVRKRKVYSITAAGGERLAAGSMEWRQFAEQLFHILGKPAAIRGEQ
ncbi:MAG: PadR family transcriptional regulator [Anaerolineae bacterium]|nr:PadR family transcriptional regulator [Anaerolineae bacterium]